MDDHRQAICYFTPHDHSDDQRQATMIIQQLRVLPHGHGHMLCEYSLIHADHMNRKPPVMSLYAILTTTCPTVIPSYIPKGQMLCGQLHIAS